MAATYWTNCGSPNLARMKILWRANARSQSSDSSWPTAAPSSGSLADNDRVDPYSALQIVVPDQSLHPFEAHTRFRPELVEGRPGLGRGRPAWIRTVTGIGNKTLTRVALNQHGTLVVWDVKKWTGGSKPSSKTMSATRRGGDSSAMALWPCKQRNDRQEPPSLPRAKPRSSCNYLHGTPICSTQFLHRPIMSIFTEQYQYNIGLPSSVQHDGVGCMTELAALII